MFERIRKLRPEASRLSIASSIVTTIIAIVLLPLHISMIIVGVVYCNDCIIQPYIPLWLAVGGSTGIFSVILLNLAAYTGVATLPPQIVIIMVIISILAILFCLAWFICGNIWVYGIYGKVTFDYFSAFNSSSTYCNKLLYEFAFWVITGIYCFLGLVLVVGIIIAIIVLIIKCCCRRPTDYL